MIVMNTRSRASSLSYPAREELPLWIRRRDGDADQIQNVLRHDDKSFPLGIEDVLLLTTQSFYPTITLTLATSRVALQHYHYPTIIRIPTTSQSQLTSPSPPQLQQLIPTHFPTPTPVKTTPQSTHSAPLPLSRASAMVSQQRAASTPADQSHHPSLRFLPYPLTQT